MTEAWFSEIPRWFAMLSLLSLLAIPAAQGRFKKALTATWIAAMAAAGALLIAAVIAVTVGQPPHVVRGLAMLGAVFGVAFGASFPGLRHAFRDAELRKTIAADL